MTYATYVREGGAPYVRSRRRRRPFLKGLLVALALSGGAMSGFWMLGQGAPGTGTADHVALRAPDEAAVAAVEKKLCQIVATAG